MPLPDDRLRAALEGAARLPTTAGVVERVMHKRAARERRRTIATTALSLTVALVLGTALALTVRQVSGDGNGTSVVPSAQPDLGAVIDTGSTEGPADVEFTDVPGEGPDVWALGETPARVWVARGERGRTGEGHLPTAIVGFDNEGAVRVRSRIDGEAVSIAGDTGTVWVLSRDRVVLSELDSTYRLKRIDAETGEMEDSYALPPGLVVAGPVAAGAGRVWVPSRAGFLVFDPETEQSLAIALGVQDRRGVAPDGDGAWVTDGQALVRFDTQGRPAGGSLAAPVGTVLIAAGFGDGTVWSLAAPAAGLGETLILRADAAELRRVGKLDSARDARVGAAGTAVWAAAGSQVVLVGGDELHLDGDFDVAGVLGEHVFVPTSDAALALVSTRHG